VVGRCLIHRKLGPELQSWQQEEHMRSQYSWVRSARFELNYSPIPAHLQLQVSSRTAWFRVLDTSLNLSRPTIQVWELGHSSQISQRIPSCRGIRESHNGTTPQCYNPKVLQSRDSGAQLLAAVPDLRAFFLGQRCAVLSSSAISKCFSQDSLTS